MKRKFNLEKLLKDIFNDKYALVVGNEIILDSRIEPTGDVTEYILRRVNEEFNASYASYSEIALDKSERINPVRLLFHEDDFKFSADDVSIELRKLLETKLFTTILTTSTTGYLEALLREIWKDELRVVNIYEKDSIDSFQRVKKTYRKNQEYRQPTLVYVFGKLEEDLTKKYIRTDTDAIRLIEKWMRMDVEEHNELLQFIRSKRLLALGCKYDDWYFRFLWYVLTGDVDSENFMGHGEVAFELNSDERSELSLQCFLNRTNICVLGDARAFLKTITDALTEESDNNFIKLQIEKSRRRNGVFISYCSKDKLIACQLYYKLLENKYDVWIDKSRLYGGDDYEKEIAEAINSAKVIIILLSPAIANDLTNKDIAHYYNKEWQMAKQLENKIIIPVVCNGYSVQADYHEYFQSIVNARTAINLMESDGFNQLLMSLKENQI